MTFKPSNPFSQSATARRAAAALLLSAALALTCAAPSQAWGGLGHPTLHASERTPPAGGFFRFLLKLLGFTGVTKDTNVTTDTGCTRDTGGTMDPNGIQ
jgi:hypothetical protein